MVKPKLKSFLRETGNGRVTLTRDPGVAFDLEDADGSTAALLDLLDGSRTVPEIAAALRRLWPDLTEDDVAEGVDGLNQAGLLEDAAATTGLTPAEQERYYNNLAFFGGYADLAASRYSYQERLRDARVTQLGVGGVGSTVLLQLAGLGVGQITVADFDVVERKNVSRQLLYTDADVGLPKLDRAVERAAALNPTVRFRPVTCRVSGAGQIAELITGSDLLVLTADSPASLVEWASRACVETGVPMVTGGVGISRASYFSVAPGQSGCVECLRLLERERMGAHYQPRHPDGIHRGISPVGGLVASLIGLEALRYLTGFAPPVAAGRYWQVDLATGQTGVALEWARRPDCPVCGDPK